jgi:hypothetical protein
VSNPKRNPRHNFGGAYFAIKRVSPGAVGHGFAQREISIRS